MDDIEKRVAALEKQVAKLIEDPPTPAPTPSVRYLPPCYMLVQDWVDMPFNIGLSVRTRNALRNDPNLCKLTIVELQRTPDAVLLRTDYLGRKSVRELRDLLYVPVA